MADEFNEENQFVTDEVSSIVRETVETVIGAAEYDNEMVKQWTAMILETIMSGLAALQKPFKYTGILEPKYPLPYNVMAQRNRWGGSILLRSQSHSQKSANVEQVFNVTKVNCAIMQKTGAGFHAVSSCLWDIGTDGCCSVRWENKFITVIVSVFGLAI